MAAEKSANDFGDGIFKIPEQNMKKFEAAIEKLSKKSVKLTGEKITPIVFSYEMHTDKRGFETKVYDVMLGGEAPKLNGWTFIAKIDHANKDLGNIVRALPGKSIPEKYRTTGCICSHCNIKRFRRDTYLLQHETTLEVKQVGRTCLKDFLGHDSPEDIAKMAELLSYAVEVGRGFSNEQGLDRKYINLEMYLGYVAQATRNKGYFVSRSMAAEKDMTATSDVALTMMLDPDASIDYKVTDDDRDLAQASIEWAQSLGDDGRVLSDYEHNIKVLAASGSIEFRSVGYAASIVGTYKRLTDAPAAPRKISNYVGAPKDKIAVDAKLKYVSQTSGRFGDGFMYMFEDNDGNMLKWFTSIRIDLEAGQSCKFTGKVKSHDEYKGVKSTVVTHCKFE